MEPLYSQMPLLNPLNDGNLTNWPGRREDSFIIYEDKNNWGV